MWLCVQMYCDLVFVFCVSSFRHVLLSPFSSNYAARVSVWTFTRLCIPMMISLAHRGLVSAHEHQAVHRGCGRKPPVALVKGGAPAGVTTTPTLRVSRRPAKTLSPPRAYPRKQAPAHR